MSAEEIFRSMEQQEHRLATSIRRLVKRFLNRIPREKLTTVTLGDMFGWWGAEVDDDLLKSIRTVWLAGYSQHTVATSLDGLDSYMARTSDRLVQGLTPPLPQDAFDAVRVAIVTGAANGWSSTRTAEHIGAVLDWDKDSRYWHGFRAETDERIDAILDELGSPGDPAREWARQYDPKVQVLRDQRNVATKHIDDDESHWKMRAEKISRTESTAAYNAGALSGISDEGFKYKEWLATNDTRTRETHRLADGQTVALLSPFIVGGSTLQMPGDPTAPPDETVNCRCAILGSDGP